MPLHAHWELLPGRLGRDPFFRGRSPRRTFRGATFSFLSDDPEDYRWNYPLRADADRDDYRPLLRLLRTLDPSRTRERDFREQIETQVAVEQWLRVLAVATAVNYWDFVGAKRGKNVYLYRAPADGLWYLCP